MARTISQLTVFVSSPGDLASDRAAVQSALDEANRILSTEGILLTPFFWERDATPGRGGADAQSIINREIENNVDLVVLLMHHRVGSETANAVSGTIEEFDTAHKVSEGRPLEVLIYFSIAPVSPLTNPEQLRKVQEFRARVGALGYLYRDYEAVVDLRVNLIAHLVEKARKLNGTHGLPPMQAAGDKLLQPRGMGVQAEEDDEEFGPLDYEHFATENITAVGPLFNALAELTVGFTAKMDVALAEMTEATELSKRGLPVDKRSVIDSFADELSEHIDRVQPLIDQIEDKLSAGSVASLHMVQEWPLESDEGARSLNEFLAALSSATDSMGSMVAGTTNFPVSLQDWPGLTLKLKKAKNRASRVYMRLLETLERNLKVLTQAREITEERLERYQPRGGEGK